MTSYKPSLKLSQFKKAKRDLTEEQMQDAIKKASARYMEPEILHDVKIAGVVKDSVKINANNPTWVQFGLTFENSASEIANMYFMVPLTSDITFTGKSGSQTTMPLANYGNFLQCMGLQGMSNAFVDRLIETDCEALNDLIGFQLRYIAKWNKKKLHGQYDNEQQAWFLVDYRGQLVSEEPYQLPGKDEVESPEQRWAEMVTAAQELGFAFENSANGQILPNPSIVNPLAQLGISLSSDKDAIEAAHMQSKPKATVPSLKPKVGVVKPKPALKPVTPPPPTPEEEEEEYDPEEFDQVEEVEG